MSANGKVNNTSRSRSAPAVCESATQVLDCEFPLQKGSHSDVQSYSMYYSNLLAYLNDGTTTGLVEASDLREVSGRRANPEAIVLDNGATSAELELDAHGCICRLDAHFA